MSDYNIALAWILFDENPAWQDNSLKWRTIMPIRLKYWIAAVLYLINLWCMTFIIIMVLKN